MADSTVIVGGVVCINVGSPPDESLEAAEGTVAVSRLGGAAFRRVGGAWVRCGVIDVFPPRLDQVAQLAASEEAVSEPVVEVPQPTESTEPTPEVAPTPSARNPGNLTYEDIDAMTKKELQALAKDCGLPTVGGKTELFNSVVEYLGLV